MSHSKDGDATGPSPPAPAPAAAAAKSTYYAPMGVLWADECADLLRLVSGVSRPLEDAVADFLARVPPERRLRFGSAVSFVLEDKMMLVLAERLIAFAILHQGYSSQLANPFVPLLINAACDETSVIAERTFLQLLLSLANGNNNEEILKQSAVDYLNGSNYESQVLLPREQLEKQYSCGAVQPQPYSSSFRDSIVKSAIPDQDVSQICVNSSEVSAAKPNRNNVVTSLLQQTSLKGLAHDPLHQDLKSLKRSYSG